MAGLTLALPANAGQIFKYQDEKGKWQYTDRPPSGQSATATGRTTGSRPVKDLKTKLLEKYDPLTPIERATLAVVLIETPIGTGSGFFISEAGLIVTNKHVVRPTSSKKWARKENTLDAETKRITKQKKRLGHERAEISKKKRAIRQLAHGIREGEVAGHERRRLQRMKNDVKRHERHAKKLSKGVSARQRAHRKRKSAHNIAESRSQLAHSFTVTLKDDTKVRASLVALSDDQDLALLRVDGYTTPALDGFALATPRQGSKVFAIGSPYGMSDSVTSGVVTRVKGVYIVTDTQVLPGNSGGPLLNEAGEVLGVNAMKVARFPSAEGFGIAIAIEEVVRAFAAHL